MNKINKIIANAAINMSTCGWKMDTVVAWKVQNGKENSDYYFFLLEIPIKPAIDFSIEKVLLCTTALLYVNYISFYGMHGIVL